MSYISNVPYICIKKEMPEELQASNPEHPVIYVAIDLLYHDCVGIGLTNDIAKENMRTERCVRHGIQT